MHHTLVRNTLIGVNIMSNKRTKHLIYICCTLYQIVNYIYPENKNQNKNLQTYRVSSLL